MPVYSATTEGPEHDLIFTAQAAVGDRTLGEGVGGSKKLAEQEAARVAFLWLREHPEQVAGSA